MVGLQQRMLEPSGSITMTCGVRCVAVQLSRRKTTIYFSRGNGPERRLYRSCFMVVVTVIWTWVLIASGLVIDIVSAVIDQEWRFCRKKRLESSDVHPDRMLDGDSRASYLIREQVDGLFPRVIRGVELLRHLWPRSEILSLVAEGLRNWSGVVDSEEEPDILRLYWMG
ncbi:hypothetical protein R1sor_017080 [Riccia sorocarpa]|uniref:Uncharacterized protein n=1 Tax=Riccia sorocarpa TaxID=122646 RepID=A0ABD3I5S4_9MARC